MPRRRSIFAFYSPQEIVFEQMGFVKRVEFFRLNHRSHQSSWADRHQLAIGLALIVLGLAALSAIRLFGGKGSLELFLGGLGAFALLFGKGFLANRGPIFPPSRITRENRWKYLILAAVLWISLFAWWWYVLRIRK